MKSRWGTRWYRWRSPAGPMVGRGVEVLAGQGGPDGPVDELAGAEVLACHPADLPPALATAMGVAAGRDTLVEAGRRHRLADLDLLAPVAPGKIIAVGLNYRDHAVETSTPIPERPLLFAKYPSAVTGPFADIHLPEETTQLDYEGELGVVVGRRSRAIPRERAREYILGYVAGNDVSDRHAQFSDGQWVRGKSFDTFAPFGPGLLVATPEFDPADIRVRTWVNGELRQDSHTGQLIFSVDDLIAYASRYFTLEVGDLILTGTPGGVGLGMDPPSYLQVGDTVRVQLTGIGGIQNRVVRAPVVSDAGR